MAKLLMTNMHSCPTAKRIDSGCCMIRWLGLLEGWGVCHTKTDLNVYGIRTKREKKGQEKSIQTSFHFHHSNEQSATKTLSHRFTLHVIFFFTTCSMRTVPTE